MPTPTVRSRWCSTSTEAFALTAVVDRTDDDELVTGMNWALVGERLLAVDDHRVVEAELGVEDHLGRRPHRQYDKKRRRGNDIRMA